MHRDIRYQTTNSFSTLICISSQCALLSKYTESRRDLAYVRVRNGRVGGGIRCFLHAALMV